MAHPGAPWYDPPNHPPMDWDQWYQERDLTNPDEWEAPKFTPLDFFPEPTEPQGPQYHSPWDPNAPQIPIRPLDSGPVPHNLGMQEAAAAGRMGDTTVAHLTPGEVVLPQDAAAKLRVQIEDIMGKGTIGSRTVGSPSASINPITGMEEFGLRSWVKKQWKSATKRVQGTWDFARGKTQKKMAADQERWYREENQKLARQYKIQLEQTEAKIKQQWDKQQEFAKKERRQVEKDLMKQKISTIKTKRDMSVADLQEQKGHTVATGEASVANPLSTTHRRYVSKKRKSFSGASMPTLRVGGSYRPA